jgi:TonB family protein
MLWLSLQVSMEASVVAGFRLALCVVVLGSIFAGSALAQSTAVIVPGAVAEGTTPAAPVKPLDIQDTDYPIESLLTNEEGKIQLNLIVSARGQVTAARVLTPTKLTRLEQQAANIARTRWQFSPAMRDGEGVAAQVNVDVNWKLPLEPVYEYQMLAEDRPLKGQAADLKLPVPANSHAMVPDDYPRGAQVLGRRGVVILRYMVLEDGSVGDVAVIHKAFPSLDEAAVKVVKGRWKFQPAQLNGKPIRFWQYANLVFPFRFDAFGDKICTSEPILSESGSVDNISYRYRVAPDGSISEVILATRSGWMRMSAELVQQFGQRLKFRSALIENRPAICWLGDVFPLSSRSNSSNAEPVALTPHTSPYPQTSSWFREEGVVKFRYFVREDGTVGDVEVVESSGHKRLDDATIKEAKTWRFRPALRDGKPTGVWVDETQTFRLN